MIIKTRIFELNRKHHQSLSDLAQAMELSISQVYRVRQGKRHINQKFIIGAMKAFPQYKFDDLFYFSYRRYAQHPKSHTGAIINLRQASQRIELG